MSDLLYKTLNRKKKNGDQKEDPYESMTLNSTTTQNKNFTNRIS